LAEEVALLVEGEHTLIPTGVTRHGLDAAGVDDVQRIADRALLENNRAFGIALLGEELADLGDLVVGQGREDADRTQRILIFGGHELASWGLPRKAPQL